VTPLGIDPGTIRLVAQCLDHHVTPGPTLHKFPYKFLQLKKSGLELFTATTFCQFLILCIGDAAKSSSSKLHYFWFIRMMGLDFSPILHEVTEELVPTEGSPNTLESSCHTEYLWTSVFYGHPPMSTWEHATSPERATVICTSKEILYTVCSEYHGAWGGIVVKVLHKSEGPGIDSWWCHWGFFPWYPRQNHVPWGQLSLWKWVPGISPEVKAASAFGWWPTTLVVPKRQEIRGLNLPGIPWATSACRGRPLLYFWI